MAAKWSLGGPLLCRGPPKDHLAAKRQPEFVIKSNTYNISGNEFHVAYHSLEGRTSNDGNFVMGNRLPANTHKAGEKHGRLRCNDAI